MSSDKFHCTNGHCLTDCVLSSIDYDRNLPPGFCPHSGIHVYWQKCKNNPTVFDTIAASPAVLAPKLVYSVLAEDICTRKKTRYYYSTITGQRYDEEAEAIAATVARLKEVYNG